MQYENVVSAVSGEQNAVDPGIIGSTSIQLLQLMHFS